jgi:N-acetyl-gamma-glutamyl-phosphate reductase
MVNVSIIGATGYTGGELLRILLRHPRVRVRHVTSESSAGQRIDDIHSDLRGRYELVLKKFDAKRIVPDTDAAFLALPAGEASRLAPHFLKHGKKVIDLAADFRLRDLKAFEKWYKVKHRSPALLKGAVYGLPELFRDQVRSAAVVANPGCYATASLLSLAPLVRRNLVDPDSLVVDAKSGVTGAGKKLAAMYHYAEATENFQAYAVNGHRHSPEIEQVLSAVGKRRVSVTFVPHLVPMARGILATVYGRLKNGVRAARVRQAFQQDYRGEAFVRLLPDGRWPQTKDVSRTNFCDINMAVDEKTHRVVVLAALDNLVKGAAGQAVQNLNLLFGFDEAEGLL